MVVGRNDPASNPMCSCSHRFFDNVASTKNDELLLFLVFRRRIRQGSRRRQGRSQGQRPEESAQGAHLSQVSPTENPPSAARPQVQAPVCAEPTPIRQICDRASTFSEMTPFVYVCVWFRSLSGLFLWLCCSSTEVNGFFFPRGSHEMVEDAPWFDIAPFLQHSSWR